MTHTYVGNLTINVSDNGLPPSPPNDVIMRYRSGSTLAQVMVVAKPLPLLIYDQWRLMSLTDSTGHDQYINSWNEVEKCTYKYTVPYIRANELRFTLYVWRRNQLANSWWRHQMEIFSAFTGPLCGEFTGHRWIPLTKARDAELWCFLWSALEQTIK